MSSFCVERRLVTAKHTPEDSTRAILYPATVLIGTTCETAGVEKAKQIDVANMVFS